MQTDFPKTDAPSVQSEAPSKTIVQLTRAEKDELNALSKDVFGATSRWQKLVNKGHPQVITDEVTEYVPSEKEGEEGETRQVKVPRRYGQSQTLVSQIKRYTVDEVRKLMLERKEQFDKIRAEIQRQRDEAQAKKDAEDNIKRVHDEAQGSAV